MRDKFLIIGSTGYVGRGLSAYIGLEKSVGTYNNSKIAHGMQFNARHTSIKQLITKTGDVFQTAYLLYGITNIDKCFNNIELSKEINVDSYKRVISELSDAKIKIIYASSDAVFDGIEGNMNEESNTNPVNVYGRQKLEIEKFILDLNVNAVIARLSKVIGSDCDNSNLLFQIAKKIISEQQIKYIPGLITNPICQVDLARFLKELSLEKYQGIYHVCGERAISRMEIVDILFGKLKAINKNINLDMISANQEELGLKDLRPLNVSMDSKKIRNETGFSVKKFEEICDSLIKKLVQAGI